MTLETLRSVVEHSVYRFQLVAENCRQQIKISDARLETGKRRLHCCFLHGFWSKSN